MIMGFIRALDISGSGLTAQKMRMDVLAQNIVNIDTTRSDDGTSYRRKMVVFQERPDDSFGTYLRKAKAGAQQHGGVQVTEIVEDERALKAVYDPSHPDANEDGYVMMPNVDKIKEMTDMMAATRAYEANITVINAIKLMANKALEIGR